MSFYIALKEGAEPPLNYIQMEKIDCPRCGAPFVVYHDAIMKDANALPTQHRDLREILSGEHVDEKFVEHLASYELD